MFDFEQHVFDYTHRRKAQQSYESFSHSRKHAITLFADFELARQRLAYLRYEAVEHLETHLLTFEENFTRQGGKIIWAENAQEACEAIVHIIKTHDAKKILKAKSATIAEIELDAFFAQQDILATETDLGNFITQTIGGQASYSQTYIAHALQAKIPRVFEEPKKTSLQLTIFELEREFTATDIATAVGKYLRPQYTTAEIGITGANFLVADIGGVAMTENEGNTQLLATFPKVHIAIAGIDKVIPHFTDLPLHWQMFSVNATGQRLAAYNTVYTGAKQPQERDGAEEMYVVLLDNGRTKMLADSRLRHALRCIKCDACAHVCPIYRLVGKEAYQSPYTGAIGAVINPHLYNTPAHFEMSHASTLCGACEEVCPVQIDLSNLLLHNRQMRVQANQAPITEKRIIRFWHKYMLNKKRWTRWNSKWKNNAQQHFFKRTWGRRQDMPAFTPKSFHETWLQNAITKH